MQQDITVRCLYGNYLTVYPMRRGTIISRMDYIFYPLSNKHVSINKHKAAHYMNLSLRATTEHVRPVNPLATVPHYRDEAGGSTLVHSAIEI